MTRSSRLYDALEVLALASLALSQPVFDLLGRNVEFLAARGFTTGETVVFTLIVGACVPLAAVAPLLAASTTQNVWRLLHAILLWVLASVLVMIALRGRELPGVFVLVLAAVIGGAAVLVYLRRRGARRPLAFLALATPVFPLLFLFQSPARALLSTEPEPTAYDAPPGDYPPVVVVIFDELPLSSLIDAEGKLDAERYPGFAALAARSHWFENATSVSAATLHAVPAILDSRYPNPPRLPRATDHPRSLFTLLGETHDMHVVESHTRVCPTSICGVVREEGGTSGLASDVAILYLHSTLPKRLTAKLPDISQGWKGFAQNRMSTVADFDKVARWKDRRETVEEFLSGIEARASERPPLHFLHVLLPHASWEILPSGQTHDALGVRIRGLDEAPKGGLWLDDPWALAQSWQRHLLQVGYADRQVAELMRRLEAASLLDAALLVVTADHGSTFLIGGSRRLPKGESHNEIMSVPLFVKLPGQREGKISPRHVETVDVLPTIAKALKLDPKWQLDGRDMFDESVADRAEKRIYLDNGEAIRFPAEARIGVAAAKRKEALFGKGDPAQLFAIGPNKESLGRTIPPSTKDTKLTFSLNDERLLKAVNPTSSFVPATIYGRVAGLSSPTPLAVAVNGVIRATTWTHAAKDAQIFSALVPPESFVAGGNRIEVARIAGGGELEPLRHVTTDVLPTVPNDLPAVGQTIDFGAAGDSASYIVRGFGKAERGHTWTVGQSATLLVPVPKNTKNVRMILRAGAFVVAGKHERQRVNVVVNGREIAQWIITSSALEEYPVVIPKDAVSDGTLAIELRMPDARSPAAIGAGADRRDLGLSVRSVTIQPAPPG